jgi:hypothetical protein
MSKSYSKLPPAKFRVGDRVRVPGYAWQGGVLEIVEDRGNIGIGGRRLYSVKKTWALDNDQPFTLPEDDLEPAPEPNHDGDVLPVSKAK